MPAVLTHKTIMLMARERLAAIRDALRNKRLNGPGPQSDLEHRVEFLADQAFTMMTDNTLRERKVDFPSGAVYATPLGRDTNPYAVMGSMGPDITAFSALFARGQAWVFDTVHKGNPDENMELVVAKTTDFVHSFWTQVASHRAANRCNDDDVRNMRAYALGHLCHIAGDVISHPYINDLEWHLGNHSRPKLSHGSGEGSIDARVAQKILLRRSTREGQDWDKWWPTHDEVPEVFFASYTEALDSMYQARSPTGRVKGFGRFEERFLERKAPEFSLDFVKDGYHLYRHGIVSIGYGWGYGSWFGMLTPMIIPLSLAIGLTAALPHSRDFFSKPFQDVDERGWFELFTLPLAVTSIVPLIYGSWVASLSTRGVEGLSGAGLAFAVVNVILAIVFFSTVGTDIPWWARWFFIFAPMAIIPLVFASIGLADFGRDDAKKRGGLALIYGVPIVLWLAFVLIVVMVLMGLGGLVQLLVDELEGDTGTASAVFHVLAMLCVMAGLIFLWIWLPKKLRDAKIPELPSPFSAERPHFVRLFDDSTLAHKSTVDTPTARQLFYPSARRPLLKIWWEGANDLWIRSEQRQLSFSTTGTGLPTQVVQAPVIPMTAKEFGAFLELRVPGLKAKPVYPADDPEEPFLPTGATFSEESDEEEEEEGNTDHLAQFKKLKKAEADADYKLLHADKPYQAIRFGLRGAVELGAPQDEYVRGPGKVTTAGTTVTGTNTLFGYFFDPGDQIAIGNQVRVVNLVNSHVQLTISAPFSPEVTTAADYLRLGPDDAFVPGGGTVTSKKKKVTGAGTEFRQFFIPGDQIVIGSEVREVSRVNSDTELELNADEDDLKVSSSSPYMRLGAGRERAEGYPYISTPATARAVGGGSIMDFAADFAALLCMGMAPHMLPSTGRKVPTLNGRTAQGGGAVNDEVGKVYQVFRNWSLDRRRLNEWRMIVAGGARSEKATPVEYDNTMLQPQPTAADWTAPPAALANAAEPVLNAQGWVPVLRQWLARVGAGDATSTAAVPGGGPTNMALSQALAYLLDLKPPVRLAPAPPP